MNKARLIEAALKEGIQDIEIFERQSKTTTLKVYEQKVDNFEQSQCNSMSIRGIYEKAMGNCYIEEDNDELIPFIIESIKQNASVITSNDEVEIYAGDEYYPSIEYSENHCLKTPLEDKITLLRNIESSLLQADTRIQQVMGVTYQDIESGVQIDNSKGVHIAYEDSYSLLVASILVKDGDDQKSAYDIVTLRDINEFQMEKFVTTLCKKGTDQLHGEPVPSKGYPILMKNEAMASLLQSLTGLFDGENAYKGISLLKDKLHQEIFDTKITIVDNPLLEDGYNSAPFDDEGVASFKKVLVDKGVLQSYMHNLKSAKLSKCTSTGNGFGGGISCSNLSIEAGNHTYDELLAKMDTGIIITELNGLHAGLNAITTEFSLQASGFYVENGQIVKPVNLITIAGNFLQLMKEITAVGSDMKFQLSGIGSPSILFPSVAVSGT